MFVRVNGPAYLWYVSSTDCHDCWRVECQAGESSVNTQSLNIFVCLQHGDIRQLSVNSDIRDLLFHHLTQSMIDSTFALCNKLSDLKNISMMSVICQEKTTLSLL